MSKPIIDLVYFEAGGGHRSAAMALQSVIAAQGRPWHVRLVNLQEVLDPLDVFRKITRRRLQDLYNLVLARNWTLGSVLLLRGMHLVIRLYHRPQVRLLRRYWTEQRPDFVVSLVPNFNRALFESLRAALPSAPFATVLTDLADYPPHFWMEKQPDQFFICGSRFAYEQAANLGHPESRRFLTSGMIVRPEFYEEQPPDRAAGRKKLGLDPSLPTGLVLFGGEGSSAMRMIARRLGNSERDLQLILVCGRNERLKRKLESMRTRNRLAVVGFTRDIPCLMSLSDFFIGKPGPGSLAEAIRMRLPVIVEQNAWTLPQERYNARWVTEQGVGMVLKSFRSVDTAVARFLEPERLRSMKEAAARIENQAVFEIPEIFERILAMRP